MRMKTSSIALVALLVAALPLAACDESEQGRILRYEPGKYQGKPDTPLTEEQREALRHRMSGQSGS
jgi:hypothetical protein